MAKEHYPSVRYRDSITGRWITKRQAEGRPKTTQREVNKIPKKKKRRK